jgi:hemolysin activation/secretion protein
LPPAVPAPAQPAELPNSPGTIKVDLFEVVGSTVFSKQELDAALKDFVGCPLTFDQLLQARSAVSQLYISKGYDIWSADWATNAHRLICEDISAKRQARKYKCTRD